MKLPRIPCIIALATFAVSTVLAADAPTTRKGTAKSRGSQPVGEAINENKATPVGRIKAAKDFKVELLYSVPGDTQGSWVNLCVDGKNRIIASDQYGGLY